MDDKTMVEARNLIRAKLCEYCLTNQWLMTELERSGVKVDKSTLSSALLGRIKGVKPQKIVSESLKIIERYGRCYADPR